MTLKKRNEVAAHNYLNVILEVTLIKQMRYLLVQGIVFITIWAVECRISAVRCYFVANFTCHCNCYSIDQAYNPPK